MKAEKNSSVKGKILKPRGRKHPFHPRSAAERLVINEKISEILTGIDDMIFSIARAEMKAWDEESILETVQECRMWLWRKSLPKYNAWRRPVVKISTFLHVCATNFIRQKKRAMRRKSNATNSVTICVHRIRVEPAKHNPFQHQPHLLDRKIEHIAQHVLKHPGRYLTESQTETFRALLKNPGVMMKDLAVSLGYKRVSSLSTIKRRIFERISAIDIEDFNEAGSEPNLRSKRKKAVPTDAVSEAA